MLRTLIGLWRPLLLVAAGLTARCSAGKGSITGRVTLNNAPVTAGVISFHSEVGNREVHNAIIRNGEYFLDEVPAGKARVTLSNQGKPPGGGRDSRAAGSQTLAVIPPRYADPELSGLSLTVQSGSQTFPVELTP